MSVEIPLTRDLFALVDDEDAPAMLRHRWRAQRGHKTWYAQRWANDPKPRRSVFMHRLLLGFPEGEVDHRNRNGLDNRRMNIRLASHSLNALNVGLRSDNKSGFRGVSWCAAKGRWRAEVVVERRWIWLGLHGSREEAAAAAAGVLDPILWRIP